MFTHDRKVMGVSQWRGKEGALFHTCAYTHWDPRPLVELFEPAGVRAGRARGGSGRRRNRARRPGPATSASTSTLGARGPGGGALVVLHGLGPGPVVTAAVSRPGSENRTLDSSLQFYRLPSCVRTAFSPDGDRLARPGPDPDGRLFPAGHCRVRPDADVWPAACPATWPRPNASRPARTVRRAAGRAPLFERVSSFIALPVAKRVRAGGKGVNVVARWGERA